MAYRSNLKAPQGQSRLCPPAPVQRGPGGPGLRPPQVRSGIPSARTGLPVSRSGIPARAQPTTSAATSGIQRSGLPAQCGLRPPQAGRAMQHAPSPAGRAAQCGLRPPQAGRAMQYAPSPAGRPAQCGLRPPQAGRTMQYAPSPAGRAAQCAPPQARRAAQIAPPQARGRGNRCPENTSQPSCRTPVEETRCPRPQQSVRQASPVIQSRFAKPAVSAMPSTPACSPPCRTPPGRSPVCTPEEASTIRNSPVRMSPAHATPCRNSPVHTSPTPTSSCRNSLDPSLSGRSHQMRSPVSPVNARSAYNDRETPLMRRSPAGSPRIRPALRMDEGICEAPPPQTDFSEACTHSGNVEPPSVRLVDLSMDEEDLTVKEDHEREELNNALSVVQSVRRNYLQSMPQSSSSSPAPPVQNPYSEMLMRRLEEFGGNAPGLDEEEMPEYMYSDELEEELNPLHEWCRQPFTEAAPIAASDNLIDMDNDIWTYSTELYRLVQL
ncbi:proline-rich protein 36-like [Ischnura elegans]|uniref:proline-rich protein 36-like n=1 Tax=Ischnura elegans TaxID=197161 RepID=UPI001ED86B22|nr:proline-rich protein 36-like [Ischnura elegans]XP_046382832.1 proline-rich protein 36-like [Ischnura elegans]XP_046382833.1 proline-rich protein 36-like [Ischnura elegans]XP_046382834.1 proline-rich protein 36-like [Ischnura elegans]